MASDRIFRLPEDETVETSHFLEEEGEVQVPYKMSTGYIDQLFETLPTPDDSGPIRPEYQSQWNIYALLEQFNKTSFSLTHFKEMYQKLEDWNTKDFDTICSHNHVINDKQKDALRFFFELMKLQLMKYFLCFINDDYSLLNINEEIKETPSALKKIGFNFLTLGTLASEGSDGILAGFTVASALGLHGLVALPIMVVMGMLNAYLHYAIDIRSLMTELGVSSKEFVLPMTRVHHETIKVTQRITDFFLKNDRLKISAVRPREFKEYQGLKEYVDCANVADFINEDVLKKQSRGVGEYKENRTVSWQRKICGGAGAGITTAFSFYADGAAILLLFAMLGTTLFLSGGTILILASVLGVLAGITYFISSMPLGLFKLFNPAWEEVIETGKLLANFSEDNAKFKEEITQKRIYTIDKEADVLLTNIAKEKDVIEKYLTSENLASPIEMDRVKNEINKLTRQLTELKSACKSLPHEISSLKVVRRELSQLSQLHFQFKKHEIDLAKHKAINKKIQDDRAAEEKEHLLKKIQMLETRNHHLEELQKKTLLTTDKKLYHKKLTVSTTPASTPSALSDSPSSACSYAAFFTPSPRNLQPKSPIANNDNACGLNNNGTGFSLRRKNALP